jgi:hypothetical protein
VGGTGDKHRDRDQEHALAIMRAPVRPSDAAACKRVRCAPAHACAEYQRGTEAHFMAEQPRQTISEGIRVWLAAVGIPVVLAVVSFWQFYLKEVWWPASAINLTTELSMKEAGSSVSEAAGTKNLKAIELSISARNPSSSTVYLCANYWAVWGVSVNAPIQGSDKNEDWLSGVSEPISKRDPTVVGKHFKRDKRTLIAVGNVFVGDTFLRPEEKISATLVFYVPQGLYDFISVFAVLPTTSKANPSKPLTSALGVDYALNSNGSGLHIASVYRLNPDGTQEKLPFNVPEQDLVRTSDIALYGFQAEFSKSEFSLWEHGRRDLPINTPSTPK